MILINCITAVGINANPTIITPCGILSADTSNKLPKNGTSKTSSNSMIPAKKAYILAILLLNPILKTDCSLLQLKPWNNRAIVSVAKAMVLANIS